MNIFRQLIYCQFIPYTLPLLRSKLVLFACFASLLITSFNIEAKVPEYQLALRDHLFYPSTLEIPADKKIKLVIFNHDDTPEEFDSFQLNREKVLFPQRKTVIFIGPLKAGEYHFFGEFNPHTATGKVIVKEPENAN